MLQVDLRQALSHFSAHVTGLRLPRTWSAIGRKVRIGSLLVSGIFPVRDPPGTEGGAGRTHPIETVTGKRPWNYPSVNQR
ncbi:hypothetical protein GCM10009690_24000 [Brevibacterium permense]|uniref:Uncharacterized protein n=1 Tax=Brevibacterium permense TaxID=234834 RepID=A0ABN2AJ67_9MICO